MMGTMRKRVVQFMAAALVLLLAAGCGGSGGAGTGNAVPGGAVGNAGGNTGGGSGGAAAGGELQGKLVIWTFFDQVQEMGKKFEEKHPGVTVDVKMFPGDQYQTKLMSALQSGDNVPDIFDLERGYIGKFINTPFLTDLSELGADELLKDYIPYVAELGKSEDGRVKAISDHSSPGGFWYNRETAKQYLGTDDPEQISRMVDNWDKIVALGKQVNEKSGGKVRLIANTGDLFDIVAYNMEPWVKDGKLHIDPRWREIYETQLQIRTSGGDAKLPFMSAGWGNALNDGTVVLTTMPAWASFMIDNKDGKAEGKYGVAKTPEGYYSGGTYRGIYAKSKNRELAYAFIRYIASPEWQVHNLAKTGNMPGNGTVYESQMATFRSPLLGEQNVMQSYYEMVKSIPARKADKYSEEVLSKWRKNAGKGVTDNAPYEDVVESFKKEVKAAFPEIKME